MVTGGVQHILDGRQPHFPCWMIRRQTHDSTLWLIAFTQPHLLTFVVHVIERGYFSLSFCHSSSVSLWSHLP